MDATVLRVVGQATAGLDVLLSGPEIAAGRLLADAGAALDGQADVVSVTSPGELSLSSLIAQLSGQTDFGGQDDAVLEAGFKRLTGAGRTVLLLLAPHGLSRSVLRYLQHVLRQAPRLSLVVQRSPSLDAMLEEPGFAAMRSRLQEAARIDLSAPSPASPLATTAAVRSLPIGLPRPRRRLLWVVSGFGAAAAIAGVAWLGHSSLRAQEEGGRRILPPVPAVATRVPTPTLASASAAPAVIAAAVPAPAELPPLAIASSPAPALASQPHGSLAAAVPVPAALLVDRPPPPRRPEPTRAARLRHHWASPGNRYDEPAGYAEPFGDDEPPPAWLRRQWRRGAPYPYAVDIYGRPMFPDGG